MKPMFQKGETVEIVASGVQGEVIEVDETTDIYTVKTRSYTSGYTRPMLKKVADGAPAIGGDGVFRPEIVERLISHEPIKEAYSDSLMSEAVSALEALRTKSWPNDGEVAEISMGLNMPFSAVVVDDAETYTVVWAPAGWVRA